MLSIPIITPASSVPKPVFAPATIIASNALPDILSTFVSPTSIAEVAPSNFTLPPPRDIDASVEDISILDAEISNSEVDKLTLLPSNFTKLLVASPT